MHRLYLEAALTPGPRTLDERARRHVRALRLRDGDPVQGFDGSSGQWSARMCAQGTQLELLQFEEVERELARPVDLAVGMPANERMDWLVEKATELGAQAITPLMCTRSVLRLHGERAERRGAHWRGVAIAACEQCGRNRLPLLRQASSMQDWLHGLPQPHGEARCVLAAPSQPGALGFGRWAAGLRDGQAVLALSGPEGGLDEQELALALQAGFVPLSLGPRTLRAETAPLALLAALAATCA